MIQQNHLTSAWSFQRSSELPVVASSRSRIGVRSERSWLGQVAGDSKLSPPEMTFGNKVLKLALHKTNERVYAIVKAETARSALFAKHLPPGPSVVRPDDGVGGEASAIRSVGDPLQPKRQRFQLCDVEHRLENGLKESLYVSRVLQFGHVLTIVTPKLPAPDLTARTPRGQRTLAVVPGVTLLEWSLRIERSSQGMRHDTSKRRSS